ncbi:hypothetical protein ILUMI_09643 [Ignelater luminosus]|uniref:Uncharacterized protein n=1 Tax=Ignelater luminosus TaxID=2038154 RepID=A0A8K0GC83_IGNLU|nr:hypothetical protein ILUMI_09643 [Ignelater luminosus]
MFVFVVLILLAVIIVKVACKLTAGRCKSNVCLVGKTALITGGNSGIGYQTALALAGRGCRVIIADKDNCDESKENIIKATGNSNLVVKTFDLASLDSVRELAKDINATEERLDILINNAGTSGLGHNITKDGLHLGMQVNHFGGFLLTHLLVDLLKKSAPSRIIFVSSIGAFIHKLTLKNLNLSEEQSKESMSQLSIYANSKLCNILTSDGFAEKLKGTGVTSNSLHPGVVYTPIYRKHFSGVEFNDILNFLCYGVVKYGALKFFAKDAEEGAQTTIYLALSKTIKDVTGKYFIDCKPFMKPPAAYNKPFAEKIWKASEDYVKLATKEKL